MNLPDLLGKVKIDNSQGKAALGEIQSKASEAGAEVGKLGNVGGAGMLKLGASIAVVGKATELLLNGLAKVGPAFAEFLAHGTKVAEVERSFRALSAAQGIAYDQMLGAGRSATKGLVSDFNLMQQANRAMALGLPITVEGFGKLSGAAITLGQATGVSATEAIERLVGGIGKLETELLDELGITVKARDAYDAYAASVGKSAKELTDAEKKVAFYNAAMEKVTATTEKLDGIHLTFTTRLNQLSIFWQNATDAAGKAIAQSPTINASMAMLSEAIGKAYGPGQQGMVAAMTDYMNRFGLGSVQVAEWAVTAYQSIKLGLISLAQIAVATNPATMFNKGLKDSLKQMEADTKASFTSQMNTLSELNEKMKKAIEDNRANQFKAGGNAMAGALGGGGGTTGGGKAGEKSFLAKFVEEMRDVPRTANEIARAVRESWEKGLERDGYKPQIDTMGITNVTGKAGNVPLEMPGIAQRIGDAHEEYWKNAPITPDEIKIMNAEQDKAAESAARWAGALQGVALMAGAIGGKLGDTINVVGNIAKSFERWGAVDKDGKPLMSKYDKFNAIAGGVGQIGGLVGGRAGGALQGAAGGAMTGASLGSIIPGVGTLAGGVIGGAIGLFGGLFGGGRQKEEERKAREAQKLLDEQNRIAEEREKRISGVATFSGGLNQYTKGGISDQASADRAGRFAMFSFGQQVKESGDIFGALDSIGPTLEKMAESAEKFGLEMPAGVQSLLQLNGLDDSIKSQVSGLNMMTKGIAESKLSTQALFTDLGAEAVATRAKLEETGLSGAQSMAIMQPSLQQLYEMQKLHGYAVDETTQALLDEAKAQGTVGDQFMSANERMVELLGILIETIGGKLPESYKRAGDAAEEYGRRAANSLPSGYLNTTGMEPVEDPGPGFAGGSGGVRDFGAGTRVTLHGREAVLTEDQLIGMTMASGGGSRGAAGGGSAAPMMLKATIVMPDGRVLFSLMTDVMRIDGKEAQDFRQAYEGRR